MRAKTAKKTAIKTAKCERTGQHTPLVDGYLVANIRTGQWSFVNVDADEYISDYNFPITDLIKSPEALVDWMAHLDDKTWFDPYTFFEFFKRFRKDNHLYNCL